MKGASRRAFRLLGIATLTFLVSHSIIANKQERFLLPVLPMLFVLIVAGLPWLAAKIARAYRGMWWYFWIVNAALLVVLMFSSSKKDRVAPLLYIYRRHDETGVLVAQYTETFQVPAYYLGKPQPELVVEQHGTEVQTTGVPINYVGHAESWDELVIDGEITNRDYAVRFKRGGRVLAMASIYRDRESLVAEANIEQQAR